jgi:hypothetical protein
MSFGWSYATHDSDFYPANFLGDVAELRIVCRPECFKAHPGFSSTLTARNQIGFGALH